MTRRGRDTLIAALALVAVSLLTLTPAGAAVRRALRARDAASVSGTKAALRPLPNRIVPLDPSALLPKATVRTGVAVRGVRGADGPAGARGRTGTPGSDGPGQTLVYRNRATLGPFHDSFQTTAITATDVPAGTWLVLGSAQLHRPSGSEMLAGCALTNGLSASAGTLSAIGGEPLDTGMTDFTSVAAGVYQSDLRQDIALSCDGTRFGLSLSDTTVSDAMLVLTQLPAASARIIER
jgi:hypothetical protein